MIGNGNMTEWGTIQGVIGRLISIAQARFVSITKSKNLDDWNIYYLTKFLLHQLTAFKTKTHALQL